MADRPSNRIPWMLVASSVIFAALLLYVLFAGYLPAKQRIAGLEQELKILYAREAELETKLSRQNQGHTLRDRQLTALSAERDALVKRLEDLERQLAAERRRR